MILLDFVLLMTKRKNHRLLNNLGCTGHYYA
ncbi:hypothetical protein DaAHT2_1576 [Desulfurivibrio alkaliphilus AHT 2]|uniref:Uncharacterized protein n=1 Tax=Desulfurivibrio alkaliphilus (strain DSM 19089 / UNIQEM U267 / AHT2) TaxID=589865 RepID=D6Z3Z6_DESAT|nr:hypothetical protein DaAHT2_1576 [Desulfurivibrio alkaliphilus AHT 2]